MRFRFTAQAAAAAGIFLIFPIFFGCQKPTESVPDPVPPEQSFALITAAPISETPRPTAIPIPTDTPTPSPTPTPTPTPEPTPYAIEATRPEAFGYRTALEINGERVSKYEREPRIRFGSDADYSAIPGVVTLRGGNWRQNPAYGTVPELTGNLEVTWSVVTKSLTKGVSGSGAWTGNGWTGQCLMVSWPERTRRVMNLYDEYKERDGWVEVIYASMDGNVYFLDAETGEPTRKVLKIGMPFKGAGALDPRGWPILYVGSGDDYENSDKRSRAMAYSLIDFARLWEVGKSKDRFALRGWHAYDSSVLIDAAADTAIIPGENGILYTLHMNTVYDEEAGTLTMHPDPVVKQRYTAPRLGDGKYALGYESSAVGWKDYVFLCDNGGYIRCIDLNTMQTVWVQDLVDDINSTPAFEETESGGYLYVGNTVDKTSNGGKGVSSFYKLDALTGEILWQYDKNVTTTSHITGGCMSSAVLGKGQLSGLVFTSFASTTGKGAGTVYAFNTETGEIVWEKALGSYTWCSPVALYTESGKGYLFLFDHTGTAYLFDAADGTVLTTLKLSENMEASPCAFGDRIVIGTRARHIFGIRVS